MSQAELWNRTVASVPTVAPATLTPGETALAELAAEACQEATRQAREWLGPAAQHLEAVQTALTLAKAYAGGGKTEQAEKSREKARVAFDRFKGAWSNAAMALGLDRPEGT